MKSENTNNVACRQDGNDYSKNDIDYVLVWSDEFDYEGRPDESKWDYDVGVHFNNELQYYTYGKNAEVRGGHLILTAVKEKSHGYDYTSARLVTKNKGDWLYGKIEVSAKLPLGRGTWPAIWMLPTDSEYGRWPASGEIDIMEHVGYNPNQIHLSAHTLDFNHTKGSEITKYLHIDNVSDKFHKYSVEWQPDQLRFSIDDKTHMVYKPKEIEDCPKFRYWPFDRRFHLIINIAVGGSWGGKEGVDDSAFPQQMIVEYVRVYQVQNLEKGNKNEK